MKNIFVGNLDFDTTEDELRQLFAAYGAVDRVTLMRDRDTGQPRGFGFVDSERGGWQQGHRRPEWNETPRSPTERQ